MYDIFNYMCLIFMVNVGKYTIPMDPMGMLAHAMDPSLDPSPITLKAPYCWKSSCRRSETSRIHHREKKGPRNGWLGFVDLLLKNTDCDRTW